MQPRNASIALLAISIVGCSSTPERAPVLSESMAFPSEFRNAVKAVEESILRGGEQPSEFHVVIEGPKDGVLTFHLWHKSAFASPNRGVNGNPGGKCRDVKFDLTTHQISSAVLWQ